MVLFAPHWSICLGDAQSVSWGQTFRVFMRGGAVSQFMSFETSIGQNLKKSKLQ